MLVLYLGVSIEKIYVEAFLFESLLKVDKNGARTRALFWYIFVNLQ